MLEAEPHRKLSFQYEVMRARLAIREHYLKTIVKEVYENIGQVLSLVRVQLSLFDLNNQQFERDAIGSSGKMVGSAIRDLRHMCQQLLPDADIVRQEGFNLAIEQEIKNSYPGAGFSIKPENNGSQTVENGRALILFNILLEMLSMLNEGEKRQLSAFSIAYSKDEVLILMDYRGPMIRPGQLKYNKTGLDLSIRGRAKLLGGYLEDKIGKHDKRKIKLVISIR